jgi:citrate lyase alpha subunit
MKTISENLASAMTKSSSEDKLGVIVTTSGEIPKEFNLKAFEGLDGLYHGQLSHDDIKKLAKTAKVKMVELDQENTIL